MVVDVQLWDQSCQSDLALGSEASLIYPGRLDISDPGDRHVEAASERAVVIQCMVLTPIIAPEVGVVYPSIPEDRLASGVDTMKVDVDIPIGLGDGSSISFAIDF